MSTVVLLTLGLLTLSNLKFSICRPIRWWTDSIKRTLWVLISHVSNNIAWNWASLSPLSERCSWLLPHKLCHQSELLFPVYRNRLLMAPWLYESLVLKFKTKKELRQRCSITEVISKSGKVACLYNMVRWNWRTWKLHARLFWRCIVTQHIQG